MKQRFINIMYMIGIATGAFLTALLVWWLVYEESPPITYIEKTTLIPPVVRAGQYAELERKFVIIRKTPLEITRYAFTVKDGVTFTYDFEPASANREPGLYHQKRQIRIPDGMIDGEYTLVTTVCWRPNIIKRQCHESPHVQFRVQSGV